MSKRRAKKTGHRRGSRASVAAHYRSTLRGGDYTKAIAEKAARAAERALGAAFAKQTLMLGPAPGVIMAPTRRDRPKKKRGLRLTKKGRADAASNLALITARGGLYGPMRPSASRPRKKRASKVPTTNANAVVAKAATAALKRWVCEGKRRSGCGAGGTRVINAKGSFVRLRPMRYLTKA